jgi:hypothetical protein
VKASALIAENWDVSEVFIGSDFKEIKRYKEFEISPQGEWIDLDIDLHKPHHEEGWTWNSGFQVSARIDGVAHIWYGAMKIPYAAIDSRLPAQEDLPDLQGAGIPGPPAFRRISQSHALERTDRWRQQKTRQRTRSTPCRSSRLSTEIFLGWRGCELR